MNKPLITLTLLGAFAALPALSQAQEMVSIGNIQRIEDKAPATWAMSGYEMFRLTESDGEDTPITRTLRYDARTVEILSRTQSPPLQSGDIKTLTRNGHYYIVVRRYMLAEVKPQDARAAGVSQSELASEWASSVRKVLPNVAPLPSRFGI